MIHFQLDAARVVVNWDNADLDLKVGKMDANLPGRLECFCSWEYKTSCHPMTLDMDSIDVRAWRISKMLAVFTYLFVSPGEVIGEHNIPR